MGGYDFEEDTCDSDNDGSLRDDIAALSGACLPSTNPIEFSDDDDEEDDLELVRGIKKQYGLGDDISHPMSLKPLTALPPVDSDDEEDDFETLRAIQRRFSAYSDGGDRVGGSNGGSVGADCGATKSKSETCVDKSSTDDGSCLNLGDERFDACRNDPEQGENDTEQGPCSTSECGDTSSHTSSFPNSAQTFIEAIKKNRSCQKFIRSKLLHIEARREEINTLQKKIKILKGYQVQCKKKIGRALSQKQDARIQLISALKQRTNVKEPEKNISPMCFGPVENSHVASYLASFTNFPLSFQREKWSDQERKSLEKGIVQQLQKMLIEKSADVLSDLGEPGYANGWDEIISSVRNFEITPEIIQDFAGKVNWEEVASMYLPRRSGAECEARWLNNENRLINKDSWTQMEDKQLLLLIQHYGINNWGLVAEKLKTNRTPFQCLVRYQRSLNASIMKREWTEDEDVQLCSAVESLGESNWTVVASTLEGRTGTQCSNRWRKTLHPSRQRVGKWSDDEDKCLKVAVTLFGQKNWYKIAQFVSGRTQVQCRERWVNVLDPSLKWSEWTEEEDLKLKKAIVVHGYCWSRIAACVPPRTDSQCRRRWKKLFPTEVPLLQAAKKIQKVALISNFVDRESERPALGPSDFVPLFIKGYINEPENDDVPQKKKSRKSQKSDAGREVASCNTSKEAQSKKRGKRLKNPEVELMDVHAVTESNHRDITLTYKRRKTSKSCSKEVLCGGNMNVTAEPKKKQRDTLKKVRLRKGRKRARSPDIGMVSDVTDAGDGVGDEIIENRSAHKSGSKKRKRSENIDIATGCRKKSRDIPIRIWSRRARGVCSKNKNIISYKPSLEENHDPKTQHDRPTNSNSKTGDDEEAEPPSVDDLTTKRNSSEQNLERESLNEIAQDEGGSRGDLATSACNIGEDATKFKRKYAKRRHEQSKSKSLLVHKQNPESSSLNETAQEEGGARGVLGTSDCGNGEDATKSVDKKYAKRRHKQSNSHPVHKQNPESRSLNETAQEEGGSRGGLGTSDCENGEDATKSVDKKYAKRRHKQSNSHPVHKQNPESMSLNETAQEEGGSRGDLGTSACGNGEDATKSVDKKYAKRQHKQSKSLPVQSEEWELPLAVLFRNFTSKQRKSDKTFRCPVGALK